MSILDRVRGRTLSILDMVRGLNWIDFVPSRYSFCDLKINQITFF
nr:MAG TPA: hypothetical protein [Caudoviricetes sp.]